MGAEQTVLEHFFSNSDKPIFAVKNMPPAIQSYFYMGVSRFPNMRERFVKMLKDREILEKTAEAIEAGKGIEEALEPLREFSAEKNRQIFMDFGHRSAAEGSTIFFVSEQNPIYATEIQQDFFFPMTTMEFSTRYAKKFEAALVYHDPKLMASEFGEEAKERTEANLELYEKGFEPLMERLRGLRQTQDLPEKISVLDSLRFLIPIACHTSVILGGNTRAVVEHFRKLLGYEDSFVKEYVKSCLVEANKTMPEYFKDLKADKAVVEREKRLRGLAERFFGKKFAAVKETVTLFYEKPTEDLALAQIIYPYCNMAFEKVLETVSCLDEKGKEEIFKAATEGRENRANPVRGFETRPLVFEVEAPWALWKDFKRNRFNLRFQQEMRGKAGFDIPELIKGSEIEKEYVEAMKKTSDLVERVWEKYGDLGKTVATQGSRKRFLMCMGARQLTSLTETRTCGEGDKGYRRIASTMIELAQEKEPRLFAHIKDNFKGCKQ